jgi:hypothetical protein
MTISVESKFNFLLVFAYGVTLKWVSQHRLFNWMPSVSYILCILLYNNVYRFRLKQMILT